MLVPAAPAVVTDFSESSKAGSTDSLISIQPVRNFPLVPRSVIVRVFSLRDLGRKKKQKGQRTSANGNHFLVGVRSAHKIQPDLRFDYVVRVFITISK